MLMLPRADRGLTGACLRFLLSAVHIKTDQRRDKRDEEHEQRSHERYVDRERRRSQDLQKCEEDEIQVVPVRLFLMQLDQFEEQHHVDAAPIREREYMLKSRRNMPT